MATFKSAALTSFESSPTVIYDHSVRSVGKWVSDSYTAPASSMPAAGDTIRFAIKIPKGSRVIQTILVWEAQASTSTLSLGITGTVAKYLAAQTMTSAGVKFGPTLYAEANLITTAEEELIGTLATAGFAASKSVAVHLLYVL